MGSSITAAPRTAFGRGYFTDWENKLRERNLLPHEYTHSWDGKFRRPADLWTPDYNTVPMEGRRCSGSTRGRRSSGAMCSARVPGMLSKQDTLDAIAATAATYSTGTPGRAWRPLVDTTNDPIIAGRAPQPWRSWQRSEDYYSEGQLIWIDVDRIIRQQSGGKRSIDDFARAFFGIRDRDWGELTYTLDDVVSDAQRACSLTTGAAICSARCTTSPPQPPLEGITQGGYQLVYTAEPTKWIKSAEKSGKNTDLTYSGGFVGRQRRQDRRACCGTAPHSMRGMTVGVADHRGQRPQFRRRCARSRRSRPRPATVRRPSCWSRRRRLPHGQARLAWRPALSAAREGRQRDRARSTLCSRRADRHEGGCAMRHAGSCSTRAGAVAVVASAVGRSCPPAETQRTDGARADRADRPAAPFGDRGRSDGDRPGAARSTRATSRGPLAGQPVLIKDNIEVAGPLPTTAGSLALANNVTNRDAPLVARLRAAGAVILGKTNL